MCVCARASHCSLRWASLGFAGSPVRQLAGELAHFRPTLAPGPGAPNAPNARVNMTTPRRRSSLFSQNWCPPKFSHSFVVGLCWRAPIYLAARSGCFFLARARAPTTTRATRPANGARPSLKNNNPSSGRRVLVGAPGRPAGRPATRRPAWRTGAPTKSQLLSAGRAIQLAKLKLIQLISCR